MPSDLIPRWKKSLSYASRSRGFLWKFALTAIALGAAIGFLADRAQPAGESALAERVLGLSGLPIERYNLDDDERPVAPPARQAEAIPTSVVPALAAELQNPALHVGHVVQIVPDIAKHVRLEEHETLRALFARRFSPAEAGLLVDYIGAWNATDPAAYARLKAAADGTPPQPMANFVLALVELKRGDHASAAARLKTDGERSNARAARFHELHALIKAKDAAALERLERDPDYAPFFTPYVRLKIAATRSDWRGILKWGPLTQLAGYEWGSVGITLVAGLAWLFFLAHLGEWPGPLSKRTLLGVAALGLGVLSTVPTLYLVVLEDDIFGLRAGQDPLRMFVYYIGAVGLREEVAKLLLFAVLLPFLIKRDAEFDALVAASFVGLGFAIEENANYFALSSGSSAPGRFLSANFFHIALTGVNGLALFRLCTRGVAGLNDFLFVFPLSIVCHGAYDALLSLPDADTGSFFAMVVFITFSLYYFNRVHELREGGRMTLSLTGAFVFGVSIVAAVVTAYQLANLGFDAGLLVIGTELGSSGILLVMFFREFNEPLSE